jgi:hypothetical protein
MTVVGCWGGTAVDSVTGVITVAGVEGGVSVGDRQLLSSTSAITTISEVRFIVIRNQYFGDAIV